jgi:hypothetical protein
VDAIFTGIEFAIGLVVGLSMMFFVARWLRYRYYRNSKLRGEDLPPDIRVRRIKDALKDFERARLNGMTSEQAREAHVSLMTVARDESLPLDRKTLEAVGREAVAMLMIASATKGNSDG